MNIEDTKEKVLGTLDNRSMTNVEVFNKLKKIIPKKDIDKAIRNLQSEGKIVSIDDTAKRRHMLLSTAIRVSKEVERLKKRRA